LMILEMESVRGRPYCSILGLIGGHRRLTEAALKEVVHRTRG